MLNEVAQWAVLGFIAFLVLGLFREISLHRSDRQRLPSTSGPALGSRLPTRLIREAASRLGHDVDAEGLTLVFVTESCVACQALLAEIPDSSVVQRGKALVIVTKSRSEAFQAALSELGLPTIVDDGSLWRDLAVSSTPLVMKVDRKGTVKAKEVTQHVDTVALATS